MFKVTATVIDTSSSLSENRCVPPWIALFLFKGIAVAYIEFPLAAELREGLMWTKAVCCHRG